MLPAPAVAQELLYLGRALWGIALDAAPAQPPAFDGLRIFVVLRDGTVRAVDHASGATRWSVAVSSIVELAASGRVVAGADASAAWGLDAGTGRALWRRSLGAKAAAAPVASEPGALFVTEAADLVLLAWDDGHESWRIRLPARLSAPLASAGGTAYVGLDDGRVMAVKLSDGSIAWIRQLPAAVLVLTPLGDRVVAGSGDNYLYALRARDGKLSWRWRTGGDIVGQAAGDGRRVYFVSMDAMLRALDAGNGTLRWQRPLRSRPIGGPLLAGELLILAGVSPELQAFRISDGGTVASTPVPGRALQGLYLAKATDTAPDRVVLLTAGGRLLAVGEGVDPDLVPLDTVPGTPLAEEAPPELVWEPDLVPINVIPGTLLPPEVLPVIRRPPPTPARPQSPSSGGRASGMRSGR